MSAFCVFGVSRMDCIRKAEKKVKLFDDKKKRNLTMTEWRGRVMVVAEELFISALNARQVSPTFDAPQFAEEWLALAKKSGAIKAESLRVRQVKTDKEGVPLKRNGKLLMTWAMYQSKGAAQAA